MATSTAASIITDEAALESLNADLDGETISEPNFLRFRAGIRKKSWNKNVVALGLASGFLEPLESTSIHLIQTAIARLMTNFPDKSFNQPDIDYYNRRTRLEYEQVRDFIVLHYHATERDDSPFWNYCRTMAIPQSLAERIAIYRENARLYRHDNELFTETSWFAVMHGQNIAPARYHPVADVLPQAELEKPHDEHVGGDPEVPLRDAHAPGVHRPILQGRGSEPSMNAEPAPIAQWHGVTAGAVPAGDRAGRSSRGVARPRRAVAGGRRGTYVAGRDG